MIKLALAIAFIAVFLGVLLYLGTLLVNAITDQKQKEENKKVEPKKEEK